MLETLPLMEQCPLQNIHDKRTALYALLLARGLNPACISQKVQIIELQRLVRQCDIAGKSWGNLLNICFGVEHVVHVIQCDAPRELNNILSP